MTTHIVTKIPTTDMLGDPSHEHHLNGNLLIARIKGDPCTYFQDNIELMQALYDEYQTNDTIKEGDNFEYEGAILAKTYSFHVVPADFEPPPIIGYHVCHNQLDELREGEFNPNNFQLIKGFEAQKYYFDPSYKGYTEQNAIDYLTKNRITSSPFGTFQIVVQTSKPLPDGGGMHLSGINHANGNTRYQGINRGIKTFTYTSNNAYKESLANTLADILLKRDYVLLVHIKEVKAANPLVMVVKTRFIITDTKNLINPAGYDHTQAVYEQTGIAIHCDKIPAAKYLPKGRKLYAHDICKLTGPVSPPPMPAYKVLIETEYVIAPFKNLKSLNNNGEYYCWETKTTYPKHLATAIKESMSQHREVTASTIELV